ncbi:UNVERIFIED_ORG: hypothetical protein M2414_004884 [Rahnella aquatilis]
MLTMWVTDHEHPRLLERCDDKQLAAWMRQTSLDEKPAHTLKLPSLPPVLLCQLAHGLFRQRHAVQLGQLLTGQRCTKVGIALADDLNRTFSKAIGQLVVAGFTAPTITIPSGPSTR